MGSMADIYRGIGVVGRYLPLVNTFAGTEKESAFIIRELAYNFIQCENQKK